MDVQEGRLAHLTDSKATRCKEDPLVRESRFLAANKNIPLLR